MHSHDQYDIFEKCSAALPIVKGNINTAQQREHREKREGPNASAITSRGGQAVCVCECQPLIPIYNRHMTREPQTVLPLGQDP